MGNICDCLSKMSIFNVKSSKVCQECLFSSNNLISLPHTFNKPFLFFIPTLQNLYYFFSSAEHHFLVTQIKSGNDF